MIYVGKDYTAVAQGSARKQVRCEQCGREFTYLVERTGTGKGSSWYFLDNEGAQIRADTKAQQTLAASLGCAVDPVACPECGWFQKNMVVEARRRRHRWILNVGVGGGAILLLFAMFPTAMNSARPNDNLVVAAVALAGLGGFGVIAGTVGRWLLVRRFDLNADWKPTSGRLDSRKPIGGG